MAVTLGEWSGTISATIPAVNWVIKDLDDPSNNIEIIVASNSLEIEEPATQAEFEPISSERKVVLSDAFSNYGAEITFTIDCLGDDAYDELRAVRNLNKKLLLQSPTGEQWHFKFARTWDVQLVNVTSRWRLVTVAIVEV